MSYYEGNTNIYAECVAQQQQQQQQENGDTSTGSSQQSQFQDGTTSSSTTTTPAATILLQCVSNYHQLTQDSRDMNLRNFLLIVSGGMIFFMQSGFAMLCAGNVRVKNVQNTMLKNLLDACGAALAFYFLGYALAFGGDIADVENYETNMSQTHCGSYDRSFIGTENFVSVGPRPAYWFFEFTFSATSVTIVAGTLAERCQMAAYLAYSVALAGFIYPVIAHSIWSNRGFLSRCVHDPFLDQGVIDFAGAGVVHLNGGLIALYATVILGPRRGRFYDCQGEPLQHPTPFPGHSVALQLLGTMILWFGWFGFNPGSALLIYDNDKFGQVAANAAVATALAGASGGVCALFTNLWYEERMTGEPKFVIQMAMNGALSGLVAVTSGCALVEPYGAIIIGVIAGWLYMLSSALLIKLRIDDAVNAIPVHMVNGCWGLIATGLLASPRMLELTYGAQHSNHPGLFYTFGSGNGPVDGNLLLCQIMAILFIFGWTFITMFPFFIWLNYKGWLRADSIEELVGLDVSYHGRSTHGEDGGKGEIKKEYIDAYNRYKTTIRKKQRQHGQNNSNPDSTDRTDNTGSVPNDENNNESDVMENELQQQYTPEDEKKIAARSDPPHHHQSQLEYLEQEEYALQQSENNNRMYSMQELERYRSEAGTFAEDEYAPVHGQSNSYALEYQRQQQEQIFTNERTARSAQDQNQLIFPEDDYALSPSENNNYMMTEQDIYSSDATRTTNPHQGQMIHPEDALDTENRAAR